MGQGGISIIILVLSLGREYITCTRTKTIIGGGDKGWGIQRSPLGLEDFPPPDMCPQQTGRWWEQYPSAGGNKQ